MADSAYLCRADQDGPLGHNKKRQDPAIGQDGTHSESKRQLMKRRDPIGEHHV